MLEVKTFPQDMSALEIDCTEPRRCLVTGLFEEPVDVNGETRSFYTYIKEGKLKAVKIGKYWRVTQENLEDFLSKGTKSATASYRVKPDGGAEQ